MPVIGWIFLAVAGAVGTYLLVKKEDVPSGAGADPAFLAGQLAEDVRRKGASYNRQLCMQFQRAAHIAPTGLYDAETADAVRIFVGNAPAPVVGGGAPSYLPPEVDTTAQDIQTGLQIGTGVAQALPGVIDSLSDIFSGWGGDDAPEASSYSRAQLANMARNNPSQLDGLYNAGTIDYATWMQAYNDSTHF